MNNKRLYKKIMNHIYKRTNCSTWDFRTLNMSYPHLAEHIFILLQNHYKNYYALNTNNQIIWFDRMIKNSYVPQDIFTSPGIRPTK